MKKYIEPEMRWHNPKEPLMDNIGVGSNPDDDGEILGKGRWDSESDIDKETDSWNDGLW